MQLNQLTILENQVKNNTELLEIEKERILSVIIISKASVEYWSTKSNLKSTNGLPWYAKDAVGAMSGLSTGLVGYAGLVAGPIGAGVALLGSAAFVSAI